MGGGDFNEIINQEDKVWGNMRGASSFRPFKAFISEMKIGEIVHNGRRWTWENNMNWEGFIEKSVDMFFGSTNWEVDFDKAVVQHIINQSSDHSMLMLDSNPKQ